MNLYLLRHASAGTRRLNPVVDRKRPLDKEGKRHCLHLAAVLSAMKVSFDLIASSPLKRSMQTASLVGTELGYEMAILATPALSPQADLAAFRMLLSRCSGHENVLVVGHNPHLTQWLAALLAPPGQPAARSAVRLRKGSLARVNIISGVATLQWLLDPRTVRALYATSTTKSRAKTSRK